MHEGDREGRLVQMVWVVVWNAEDRGSLFIKVTLLRTQWLLMQRSLGDRHTTQGEKAGSKSERKAKGKESSGQTGRGHED